MEMKETMKRYIQETKGVKHNIKFEEQKNEKWNVLLEWSRFECLRLVSTFEYFSWFLAQRGGNGA